MTSAANSSSDSQMCSWRLLAALLDERDLVDARVGEAAQVLAQLRAACRCRGSRPSLGSAARDCSKRSQMSVRPGLCSPKM